MDDADNRRPLLRSGVGWLQRGSRRSWKLRQRSRWSHSPWALLSPRHHRRSAEAGQQMSSCWPFGITVTAPRCRWCRVHHSG